VHLRRRHLGLLLEQALDEVDRLPHPDGDELGEQRDVGIGDVVVPDPAGAAVADAGGLCRSQKLVW
jgi:hypothetical protein